MKLITFVIPSYNSQSYLHHAVDTILTGGDEVEILIVNDGSTDDTAKIADEYADRYPDIVRAIHKPNGGHGSGVNRGLEEATGLFFKVVDSDDWVDEAALKTLLQTLRAHVQENIEADLYITNFIYDHALENKAFTRRWKKHLPVGKFFTWDQIGRFYGPQVLLMHSLMYKTQTLRETGTILPEHTFYVDNLFAYKPLPKMRKVFYLDVDLYHYFIGRDDQSVNIRNFTKRYDQQIRVMYLMADAYSYSQIQTMEKGLRKYMLHTLSAIMMNTMMFCCSGGSDTQRIADHDALWDHIQQNDPQLFAFLSKRAWPALAKWMPWKLRGKAMLFGYKVLCKTTKLG